MSLESIKSKIEKSFGAQKSKFETDKQELEEQLRLKTLEFDLSKEQYTTTSNLLEKSQGELSSITEQFEAAKAAKKESDAESASLRSSVEKLEGQVASLQLKKEQDTADLERLSAENKTAQETLESRTQEMSDLQSQIELLEKANLDSILKSAITVPDFDLRTFADKYKLDDVGVGNLEEQVRELIREMDLEVGSGNYDIDDIDDIDERRLTYVDQGAGERNIIKVGALKKQMMK